VICAVRHEAGCFEVAICDIKFGLLFFRRNKSDLPFRRKGHRCHKISDCIKDHLELSVVLLFHGGELAGQVFVGRQEFPQSNEGAHYGDVDLDGALAVENA